ncbi:hypothetical protein PVK06_030382 [Gossypium arboreum]|uniref:Uncharacterized protein n=1 Tax=Gossypium arboreum TaxID=29729 RepID=A0ABR0NP32_GOSAR|nr:hypothetical protein PVK06_030382 [Gossypium arboreum]
MVLDFQGYGASVEYSEPSTEYGSNPFGSTNESCSNQPGNKTLSSSSKERSDQPRNGNVSKKKGESYGHRNYHNGRPKALPKSMWIEAKQIGWQKTREAVEGCRRRCRRGMPMEM